MDFDPPVIGSDRQNVRYRHNGVEKYPYMARTSQTSLFRGSRVTTCLVSENSGLAGRGFHALECSAMPGYHRINRATVSRLTRTTMTELRKSKNAAIIYQKLGSVKME